MKMLTNQKNARKSLNYFKTSDSSIGNCPTQHPEALFEAWLTTTAFYMQPCRSLTSERGNRVCCIVLGGRALMTGFLVTESPDAELSAWACTCIVFFYTNLSFSPYALPPNTKPPLGLMSFECLLKSSEMRAHITEETPRVPGTAPTAEIEMSSQTLRLCKHQDSQLLTTVDDEGKDKEHCSYLNSKDIDSISVISQKMSILPGKQIACFNGCM